MIRAFRAKASHLFDLAALALSMVFGVYVWLELTETLIPPGQYSGFYYLDVNNLQKGVVGAPNLHLLPMLAAVLNHLGLDSINALSIVVSVSYTCSVFAAYIASRQINGRKDLGLASLILTALFPALFIPLAEGAYPIILGLAMATSTLAFTVLWINSPRRLYIGSALILAAVMPFAHLPSAVAMTTVLFAWLLITWHARVYARAYITALAMVSLGILLILHPWYKASNALTHTSGWITLKNLFNPMAYPVLLLLLVGSLALGFYTLYRKRGFELTALASAWLILPLIAAAAAEGPFSNMFLVALPAISTIAVSPLTSLQGSMKLLSWGSVEAVVEIELDKLAAGGLTLLLIVYTLMQSPYYAENMLQGKRLSQDMVEDVQSTATWLRLNTAENATVAAPVRLLPWLSGLSGRSMMPCSATEDLLAADTMASTSYRMRTPYLLVDEGQPLSASRAPGISAYDGEAYQPLVYIDDSYIRVELSRGGETWWESPAGAVFRSGEWVQSEDSLGVRLEFTTQWLLIEKTLTALKSEPVVEVCYNLTPMAGAVVQGLSFSLWAEWGTRIEQHILSGCRAFLTVREESVEVNFEGADKLELTVQREYVQDRLTAFYKPGSPSLTAKAKVTVASAKPSQSPVWKGSLLDLAAEYKVKYLTALNQEPRHISNLIMHPYEILYVDDSFLRASFKTLKFRDVLEIVDSYARVQFGPLEKLEALSIIDAFIRIAFEHDGTMWTEAPSGGTVTAESLEALEEGWMRQVRYETAGLNIEKVVATDSKSATLAYTVKPKKGVLKTFTFTAWLPWERRLLKTELMGNVFTLVSDAGTLSFSFNKTPLSVEASPHPEYKQLRLEATLPMEPSQDSLQVQVKGSSPLTFTYEATTRPQMEASDILGIRQEAVVGLWVEAPANAYVKIESLVDGTTAWNRSTLYETAGLKILKCTQFAENTLSITYRATPSRSQDALQTLNLTTWIGWGLLLTGHNIDGNVLKLRFETGDDVRLIYQGNITSLQVSKDEEFNRYKAVASFALNPLEGEASLRVEADAPSKAEYLPTTRPQMQSSDSVTFYVEAGKTWVEAPSQAFVTKDQTTYTLGGFTRDVAYRTRSLSFEKRLQTSRNDITLTYTIRKGELSSGGEAIKLLNFTFIAWIPWERQLFNQTIIGDGVNLNTDVGNLQIQMSPSPVHVSIVLHPQFRQTALNATYSLPDEGASITMVFKSPQNLDADYIETTRPTMVGSDVQMIYMEYGFFESVYSGGHLTVYRLMIP